MPFGESFRLAPRRCLICNKMDVRYVDRIYRLLRLNARPDKVAHPWCLVQKHGEAAAKTMVPDEEWEKRAAQ